MNNNILPGPVEAVDIQRYLPHRYPFLLIDRVLSMQLEPEKRLIGMKNITINEPFFEGHFPGNPVMPGVLMIEAMAQAAGMLAHLDAEVEGKVGELYYLVKVDNARFSQVVVPGDQLILDVIQKRIMRRMGQYECQALVGEKRVASCELLCAGKQA
ncbi:MAG: 3-hydroxyacyl-ACP dehydratase FabZ [Xanthomonadales bacterium]|nr:3-hydroxyacyl-ACP dehydratase FabZ [Gammaproteobacteria bacterium]MBT8054580.1 3-hydroxyacyl-ACP dehydratase FabZ [Gammaproteobacteria bacterium]NND55612.1 3-hydroxyacyl-ACP dehydratase FabZ [Xanthomonadales bacterium]NNK50519.1 3-hydroxyacyl-ACP dehydratase FabZ [Xanthomonadales bacterium]